MAPLPAFAVAVYGFADIVIDDFVVTQGTVGKKNDDQRAILNLAEYGGFNQDATEGATDATQAKSGPGPFPGGNFFAEQGRVGSYARADSQITAPISSGDKGGQAFSVVEAFLIAKSTTADAGVNLKLTAKGVSVDPLIGADGAKTIGVSFRILPSMSISTSGKDDRAVAMIDFYVELLHNDRVVFDWSPCGDANNTSCFFLDEGSVVQGLIDPFTLNKTIECGPARQSPCSESYSHPFGLFSFNYKAAAGMDGPFLLRTRLASDVRLQNVPEPGALVLVATALGLLIVCARQR